MKKKKIYINEIKNKIGNNQDSCMVDEKIECSVNSELTVKQKLDNIFNTNGYVFNVKVKIITINKTYDTKIASLVGNNIITLDNDIINIDDIKDIVY